MIVILTALELIAAYTLWRMVRTVMRPDPVEQPPPIAHWEYLPPISQRDGRRWIEDRKR